MLNEKLQKLANENNGELPHVAWPGLYPMFYIDDQGNTLCPKCANKHDEYSGTIIEYTINWEDENLYCDDCSEKIESAYGEE